MLRATAFPNTSVEHSYFQSKYYNRSVLTDDPV